MTESGKIEGGCLCGAVRYSMELPSKWCAHCHCTMCRRAHGAGYVTWVGFERDHFTLLTGDHHLTWYESSAGARRGFCSTCGSTMLFESARWPGEINVVLGCIDGPIDREPQAHVFHDSHVSWMALDDALKAYNP